MKPPSLTLNRFLHAGCFLFCSHPPVSVLEVLRSPYPQWRVDSHGVTTHSPYPGLHITTWDLSSSEEGSRIVQFLEQQLGDAAIAPDPRWQGVYCVEGRAPAVGEDVKPALND